MTPISLAIALPCETTVNYVHKCIFYTQTIPPPPPSTLF